MYFDEDLLLDIRLNTLNKFVFHKFVITEATYTHNGSRKKLNNSILTNLENLKIKSSI